MTLPMKTRIPIGKGLSLKSLRPISLWRGAFAVQLSSHFPSNSLNRCVVIVIMLCCILYISFTFNSSLV